MEFYIDHPEKMDIHATQKFHGIHATKKSKIFKFSIFFKKIQNFQNLQFLHLKISTEVQYPRPVESWLIYGILYDMVL